MTVSAGTSKAPEKSAEQPVQLSRLDRFIRAATATGTLILSFLVVVGACRLFWEETPTAFLKVIEDHWKAALLCFVPLFYIPLRSLFDRVKKAPGWEFHAQSQRGSAPSPAPDPSAPTPTTSSEDGSG